MDGKRSRWSLVCPEIQDFQAGPAGFLALCELRLTEGLNSRTKDDKLLGRLAVSWHQCPRCDGAPSRGTLRVE